MALCQQWCTIDDLCCDKKKYSEDEIAEAIAAASETLDMDSYHQYGVCEYTVSPGQAGCPLPRWLAYQRYYSLTPQVISGTPIVDVTAINVFDENGDEITNSFESDVWWEFDTLYFPSTFVFPTQSQSAVGSALTWNIELTAGRTIPALGKKAAIELALELLKDPCDSDCALPPEVIEATRDGASYKLAEIGDALAMLPRVNKFYQTYCRTRRWSGAVSPLNYQSQLVT